MGNLVAVYGSLKQGFHNHKLINPEQNNSLFVGRGYTIDRFIMYSLGSYPAISREGEGNLIDVEVYDVDDLCLLYLDMLEGHPKYYERKQVTISMYDTTLSDITAWIYILPGSRVFPRVMADDNEVVSWTV